MELDHPLVVLKVPKKSFLQQQNCSQQSLWFILIASFKKHCRLNVLHCLFLASLQPQFRCALVPLNWRQGKLLYSYSAQQLRAKWSEEVKDTLGNKKRVANCTFRRLKIIYVCYLHCFCNLKYALFNAVSCYFIYIGWSYTNVFVASDSYFSRNINISWYYWYILIRLVRYIFEYFNVVFQHHAMAYDKKMPKVCTSYITSADSGQHVESLVKSSTQYVWLSKINADYWWCNMFVMNMKKMHQNQGDSSFNWALF